MDFRSQIVPVGDHTIRQAQFSSQTFNGAMYHEFSDGQAPALALDVAAGVPRLIGQATWDPATRTATWPEEPGSTGAVPQTLLVQGSYFKQATQLSVQFNLYMPYPAAPTFTLPAFPTELADLAPVTADGGFVNRVQGLIGTGKTSRDNVSVADLRFRNIPFNWEDDQASAYWVSGYFGK